MSTKNIFSTISYKIILYHLLYRHKLKFKEKQNNNPDNKSHVPSKFTREYNRLKEKK